MGGVQYTQRSSTAAAAAAVAAAAAAATALSADLGLLPKTDHGWRQSHGAPCTIRLPSPAIGPSNRRWATICTLVYLFTLKTALGRVRPLLYQERGLSSGGPSPRSASSGVKLQQRRKALAAACCRSHRAEGGGFESVAGASL
jgi:hypothetical protein